MATLQVSTASNAPTVDHERVDELRPFLTEWLLGTGPFDDLTADVIEPEPEPEPEQDADADVETDSDTKTGDTQSPYLVLYGYASFGPAHCPTARDAARDHLDADGGSRGSATTTATPPERARRAMVATEPSVRSAMLGAVHARWDASVRTFSDAADCCQLCAQFCTYIQNEELYGSLDHLD
jgi:hypothetical protein